MDVNANILIQAVGGDAAAAQINKASDALHGVGTESGHLEEQFQHKFQHIGLMLFVGEALRANGVGAETRQVIGVLNLAMMTLAQTAGATAAAFLPWIAGLVAVIGLTAKIVQHHKEHEENLQKLIETQDKEVQALGKSIKEMQDQREEHGELSKSTAELLRAKKALADFLVNDEKKALQEQIVSLKETLIQEYENVNAIRATIQAKRELTVTQTMLMIASGDWNKILATANGFLLENGKATHENAKAIAENNVKLAEAKKRLDELNHGVLDNTTNNKKNKDSIEGTNTGWETYIKNVEKGNRYVSEARRLTEGKFKEEEKGLIAVAKMWDNYKKESTNYINAVYTSFGNATAKMLVEGKSFTKEMEQAFKHLAEQVISMITQMIAKWLVFKALTGGFGMGGGLAGSLIGAKFASGGSMMVNSPTLFLAGEGEPERVQVTPLSKSGTGGGGGNGGGGNTYYIQPHIHGIKDPDAIAAVVGRKIVENIRGRGNVSFGRT